MKYEQTVEKLSGQVDSLKATNDEFKDEVNI